MDYPRYLCAYESGRLAEVAQAFLASLSQCGLCPHACGANRLKDEMGKCRTGRLARVCSFFAHHGEEPPISGQRGSGTIFFSECNMSCVYCQNAAFSQLGEGRCVSAHELADCMLSLQEQGCHNINFVTPTHVLAQILEALVIAVPRGLRLPLVYNTSGYECASVIRKIDGMIDIYMPDMRYSESQQARLYSFVENYAQCNRDSVQEMFRQVGSPVYDEEGLMRSGLLIRHLVLPADVAGSAAIFQFIATHLSKDVPVSLMSQYDPLHRAMDFPSMGRRITIEEYEFAIGQMRQCGLESGWIQESQGLSRLAGIHIKKNI